MVQSLQKQNDFNHLRKSFQQRAKKSTFPFPFNSVPEPHRAQMLDEITEGLFYLRTNDLYTLWKQLGKLPPCFLKCYYNDPLCVDEDSETSVAALLPLSELPEAFHFSFPPSPEQQ